MIEQIIETAKTVQLPGAIVLAALVLGGAYVIGQLFKIFR